MKIVTLLVFTIFVNAAHGQKLTMASYMKSAIEHRQNQLMAHHILWGYGHNLEVEKLDQEQQTFTGERAVTTIEFKVQVLGTYNQKDSSFLWSIDDGSI